MKKFPLFTTITLFIFFLAACGGGAAPEPQPAPTIAPTPEGSAGQLYVVDTAASEAAYIVNEEFFADALDKYGIEPGETVVEGTTPVVNGQLQINLDADPPIEDARFTADLSQLATNQNQRDNWLRDNALVTNQFPQATFVMTDVSGLPETITRGEAVNFQMTGDLTVKDVTREVTFDVTATLSAEDVLTGTAVLNVNISDFGITPPSFAGTLTVEDPFRIEVDLTARPQAESGE